MNVSEALHTAARRYCQERADQWRKRYSELSRDGRNQVEDNESWTYSEEALATFPRYNVVDAILMEVERFVPHDFTTVQEAREVLILAGKTAESVFTKPPQEATAISSMNEERALFAAYLAQLNEDHLLTIQRLPFRRVLGEKECQHIWQQVDKRWQTGKGYWYPLIAGEAPSDVLAFQERYFDQEVGAGTLRSILVHRGITRLWQLREHGAAYEIDLELFEPYYTGAEGYWTSGGLPPGDEWLIYASHESSITIAGLWLLEAVKSAWSGWERRIYTSWDYE